MGSGGVGLPWPTRDLISAASTTAAIAKIASDCESGVVNTPEATDWPD